MAETEAAPIANETRGEISILLDAVEHVMRPSHSAIVAFETATGKSLISLARSATEGDLTLRDMGTIATECIREYGRQANDRSHAGVNEQRVRELILDLGPLNAVLPIQRVLLLAATGGVTSKGEVKAVAEATEATATA